MMDNLQLKPQVKENEKPVRSASQASDEIDLNEFFYFIWKLGKRSIFFLLTILASVRRGVLTNRKILLLMFCVGFFGGGAYSLLKENDYECSMVVSSSFLNFETLNESVAILNRSLESENYSWLKVQMGFDSVLVQNIKFFRIEKNISEFESEISVRLKEMLASDLTRLMENENFALLLSRAGMSDVKSYFIRVGLSEPVDLKLLQSGLMSYFQNHEFINKRLKAKQDIRLRLKANLEAEVHALDSLSQVVISKMKTENSLRGRTGSNNVVLGETESTNPLDLFNRKASVAEQIRQIEFELITLPDFEVVEDLTIAKTKSMNAFVAGLSGGIVSTFVVLIAVAIIKFDAFLGRLK